MTEEEVYLMSNEERFRYYELKRVGFIFSIYEQTWLKNFIKFQDFVATYDRYPNLKSIIKEEKMLSEWVSEQRKRYWKAYSNAEQEEKLDEIDKRLFKKLCDINFKFDTRTSYNNRKTNEVTK